MMVAQAEDTGAGTLGSWQMLHANLHRGGVTTVRSIPRQGRPPAGQDGGLCMAGRRLTYLLVPFWPSMEYMKV